MVIERTFVMIKPDGVQRGLIGEIVSRFEKTGLKIVGMKFIHVEKDFSKRHYADLADKPFFEGLATYLTIGPVIAFVLEGAGAISLVRKIVGATEPHSSLPGTIRGDYAHMNYKRADQIDSGMPNLIHASDSSENAQKEINLWFSQSELYDNYQTVYSKFM